MRANQALCFKGYDSLFIIAPIVCEFFLCCGILFCHSVFSVLYSFAIILLRKRESWLFYFNCLPDGL